MSIILVQLGDIHIRGAEDNVLRLADPIGAAIAAEATHGTKAVVLAICGDIAFSGKKSEFEIAKQFLNAVKSRIQEQSSAEVRLLTIPGNHDCDFSADQTARNSVMRQIPLTGSMATSVREIVLKPLHEYFSFSEAVCQEGDSLTLERPFYHFVDIGYGNSVLRLHLINTAWASSLHERQGDLTFPLMEMNPPVSPAQFSVALLHHPIHWLSTPAAMRELRDSLAGFASVALVNHEHEPEATELKRLGSRAPGVVYVSGGALQVSGSPGTCSFNTIQFKSDPEQLILTRHELALGSGKPFFKIEDTSTIPIGGGKRVVGRAGYQLKQAMAAYLDDPGVPITHPQRDPRVPLGLSDIFLYPDLWELDADHDGSARRQIKSDGVPGSVLASKLVLITGGEKSGRTSLIKQLYLRALADGKAPLLLRGGTLPKKGEGVRHLVRNEVAEEYENILPDAYEQLPRDLRVVLVDDIHRISVGGENRDAVIAALDLKQARFLGKFSYL